MNIIRTSYWYSANDTVRKNRSSLKKLNDWTAIKETWFVRITIPHLVHQYDKFSHVHHWYLNRQKNFRVKPREVKTNLFRRYEKKQLTRLLHNRCAVDRNFFSRFCQLDTNFSNGCEYIGSSFVQVNPCLEELGWTFKFS